MFAIVHLEPSFLCVMLASVAVVVGVSCGQSCGCSVDRGLCCLVTMGKDLIVYTVSFKLKVVAYVEEHGKRATGRKFDVNEKCVRQRCSQNGQLAGTNRNKKAFCGKPCKFLELEKELVEYVTSTRKNGYAVLTEMIGVKAIAIARHMGILLASFKAAALHESTQALHSAQANTVSKAAQ